MPSPRSRAFSMPELLIVATIIGILASLGLASFQMARRSADAVRCLGGLRQIQLACMAYASDFRQALPTGRFLGHNAYVSYDDLLAPYDGRGSFSQITGGTDQESSNVVNAGIDPEQLTLWNLYRCPGERIQQRSGAWDRTKMVRSYALNGAYDEAVATIPARYKGVYASGRNPEADASPDASAQAWSIRLPVIPDPASTILLAEIRYLYGYMGGSLGETVANPGKQVDARLTTEPLHRGGWNYLFADGHADHLQASDTVAVGKPIDSNQAADMAGSLWWRE